MRYFIEHVLVRTTVHTVNITDVGGVVVIALALNLGLLLALQLLWPPLKSGPKAKAKR